MKSSMADPSLKNSGLEATSKAQGTVWFSLMIALIICPVPTGTVLLVTTTLYPFMV